MRPKHILPLLLLVILFSCKSKTALQFNEKIIGIERSLTPDITSTEERVGKFFEAQQYDSAAAASSRMESLVDSKLKEVEALPAPDVKEADNLKKAAVRYFAYLKSVYTSYKDFSTQTTDDTRETARLNLVKIANQKDDALKDIQVAQKKYAEANGFKIENK
jgi:hypothetical protein